MTKNINGLLFGDKGYIKQELFDNLYKRVLKLFLIPTKLEKAVTDYSIDNSPFGF